MDADDPHQWYHELRARYAEADVAKLDDRQWQEWLSCHNVFDRNRARGRRANHRLRLEMAAKAARVPP